MTATNSTTDFGWVTRALHWVMALGVLAMLALGSYIARMEVGLSNLWLFGLHKSIGVILLALLILRLIWHLISPPPISLPADVAWKDRAAKAAHRAFYVLLIAVPLSGWIGSGASGLDVLLFDRVRLPPLAPVSEQWEAAAFTVHFVLTKLLAALALLHIAGALLRRDGTLRRMVRGSV